MKFALLCDDERVRPIIQSLNSQVDGHSIGAAVRVNHLADNLLHGLQNVAYVDHWEDILIAPNVDAVIVGGFDGPILEGAKQIAAAGIPILMMPTADQGSTFIYELGLIRDDNRVVIQPVFWHRYDSAVLQVKNAIDRGELGPIQYLSLERSLSSVQPGEPISQELLDEETLQNVDVMRWLIGSYNQITCLQTAATAQGALKQSVVMSGKALPEANLAIDTVAGTSQWTLTLRGERGTATLVRDSVLPQWTATLNSQTVAGDLHETSRQLKSAFSNSVSQAKSLGELDDGVARANSMNRATVAWGDLVKSFETVDATHRSLQRRRTIDLHFEQMSERAIFKTQMTAIGCSMLIATFFMTLIYLAIASLIPLSHTALIVLRTVVFAPLGLFLLAQLLLPLTRPASESSQQTSNSRLHSVL